MIYLESAQFASLRVASGPLASVIPESEGYPARCGSRFGATCRPKCNDTPTVMAKGDEQNRPSPIQERYNNMFPIDVHVRCYLQVDFTGCFVPLQGRSFKPLQREVIETTTK